MEIKTIKLQGKDYTQVHERIRYFRTENEYKNWGITTSIEKMGDNSVLFKATIVNAEDKVMEVGHSMGGYKGDKALEKTETVAVGRALSLLAIGVDGGIASLDEMVAFLNKK